MHKKWREQRSNIRGAAGRRFFLFAIISLFLTACDGPPDGQLCLDPNETRDVSISSLEIPAQNPLCQSYCIRKPYSPSNPLASGCSGYNGDRDLCMRRCLSHCPDTGSGRVWELNDSTRIHATPNWVPLNIPLDGRDIKIDIFGGASTCEGEPYQPYPTGNAIQENYQYSYSPTSGGHRYYDGLVFDEYRTAELDINLSASCGQDAACYTKHKPGDYAYPKAIRPDHNPEGSEFSLNSPSVDTINVAKDEQLVVDIMPTIASDCGSAVTPYKTRLTTANRGWLTVSQSSVAAGGKLRVDLSGKITFVPGKTFYYGEGIEYRYRTSSGIAGTVSEVKNITSFDPFSGVVSVVVTNGLTGPAFLEMRVIDQEDTDQSDDSWDIAVSVADVSNCTLHSKGDGLFLKLGGNKYDLSKLASNASNGAAAEAPDVTSAYQGGIEVRSRRNGKDYSFIRHSFVSEEKGVATLYYEGLGAGIGGYAVRMQTAGCTFSPVHMLEASMGSYENGEFVPYEGGVGTVDVQDRNWFNPGSGFLGFRIKDDGLDNDDNVVYGNNTDSLKLNILTDVSPPHTISDGIMVVSEALLSILYGEKVDEAAAPDGSGGFSSLTRDGNGVVPQIFNNLIGGRLGFAMRTALLLFIVMTGVMYISGLLEMNKGEFVMRVVKLGIMVQLLSESSWDFFNYYLFGLFIDGVPVLTNMLVGAFAADNVNYQFGFVDQALMTFFSPLTWYKILSLAIASIMGLGIVVALLFIVAAANLLLAFAKGVLIYLIAIISIALLLAMAPVFIIMSLFKLTHHFFDEWIKHLASYLLQPVLVFVTLVVISQVIVAVLNNILAFGICWGCALPFSVSLTQGVDLSFCIVHFFIPWTWMNVSQVMAAIFFNTLLFLILSEVAFRYVDWGMKLASSITGEFSSTLNSFANNAWNGTPLSRLEGRADRAPMKILKGAGAAYVGGTVGTIMAVGTGGKSLDLGKYVKKATYKDGIKTFLDRKGITGNVDKHGKELKKPRKTSARISNAMDMLFGKEPGKGSGTQGGASYTDEGLEIRQQAQARAAARQAAAQKK